MEPTPEALAKPPAVEAAFKPPAEKAAFKPTPADATLKQTPETAQKPSEMQPVELEQLHEKSRNMPPLAIRSVMERVPLLITVELGRAEISLKDLRALRQGQVITLAQIVGEPLGVYANGQHLGHGDVVSVGKDQYGIRITALAGVEASGQPDS